jgi:hypothetical protein
MATTTIEATLSAISHPNLRSDVPLPRVIIFPSGPTSSLGLVAPIQRRYIGTAPLAKTTPLSTDNVRRGR